MTDYPCIKLRKLTSKDMPTRILYLDTETRTKREGKEERHRLRLAWTCLSSYTKGGTLKSESWEYWTNSEKLWCYVDALVKAKHTVYIVAHNIFFDLQASDFFYYFTKWGWVKEFYYESHLTYILIIQKDGRFIKCLSSTNWYDTSLKGLGDMMGMAKGRVDFESVRTSELKAYCRNDVAIVKAAMETYLKFIRVHKLGGFALTKASQAFNAYRSRFMRTPIYIHKHKEAKALERSAYFGGRVECFELGKIKGGPFVSLDINSQYPYVMKQSYLPSKLVCYERDVGLERADANLADFCCIAEIDVRTDLPMYPIRQNDKIIYPIGEFTTTVCTKGLKEALRRGHVLKIKQLATYTRSLLFADYVDYLYPFKDVYGRNDEPVMRELIKKMLNSLYGKFGQKKPIVEEFKDIDYEGYWRQECFNLVTGERGVEYKMFNTYSFEYGYEDATTSFVAISAHITEAARMLLWHIIETTGLNRVLYIDTDSIKIRKKHLKYVKYPIDSRELGALALEDEFETFEIIGAKTYKTEKTRTFKGVPKSAREVEPDTFEYQTWNKQKTHMKNKITRFYSVRDTVKVISRAYDKGLVLPNGKVRPFTLSLR